jgi:hypothetical protein
VFLVDDFHVEVVEELGELGCVVCASAWPMASPEFAVAPGEVENRPMERLRLLGAASGAVFAIVTVVAFAITQGPSSAADVKVIDYYTQHGNAAIWQAVLAGFGIVCLVWFAAVFSGWSPLGSAVLVSAAVIAALYSVALGSWESLGENFKNVDVIDVSSETYRDAHFLYDVGVGAAHMALFMDAAFVGATTAALFTTAVPRRRLGAIGIVLTAVFLINAPLQIFGTANWTDAVGTIVFLGLLAWVFVLSIVLVVSLRQEAAAAPAAAAAT